MKLYLASLAAGLLVGIIYGVLNVRSPAPPVVALVGLLGILLGEQLPPLIKQWRQLPAAQSAGLDKQVRPPLIKQGQPPPAAQSAGLDQQMRPPLIKRWWLPAEARTAWLDEQVKPHCFGQLPGASVTTTNTTTTSDVKTS